MKSNKNLIRLTLAIMLVISLTFSLTSCVFDLGFILEELFSSEDFGNGEGEENPTPGNGSVENNEINSDNYGDFYPGSGQGNLNDVSKLSRTLLSTVSIICEFSSSAGAGSGVIYKLDKTKGDAYIITNYHVVYTSKPAATDKISIYLYGMESSAYAIPATLVGGSVTYDVAVLKITGSEVLKNSYATAATIGISDDVRVFDKIFAVGNAEGAGLSATEGIVSVDSENIELNGADESSITIRVMRIDAPVNHGNSGGGLYDEEGRFIGIVSAKEVSEDIDNMGYAIPSDLVIKVANNILRNCNGTSSKQVKKALLGITISAYVTGLKMDNQGCMYKVEMVEVVEVSNGSLADGKVKIGDVINSITVDGVKTTVTRMHHVTDAMLDANAGSTVVLNVTRDGKAMDITFTVSPLNVSKIK